MKRCFQVSAPTTIEAFEERQLQMLDVYPELARRGPGAGADRITGTYVEVVSDDETTGLFGPIFDETAPIILAKLAGHGSIAVPDGPGLGIQLDPERIDVRTPIR